MAAEAVGYSCAVCRIARGLRGSIYVLADGFDLGVGILSLLAPRGAIAI